MNKQEKSYAFTLAEALLTISIIGITMALMLRGINRINPDKEKILFIKTYHAIEYAVANIINDHTKYNPNTYSETDLEELSEEEQNDLSLNFSHRPLKNATAIIDGKKIQTCIKQQGGTCISQENALCYFLAEKLNAVGEVNCDTTHTNIKTTTGVCLRNLGKQFDDNLGTFYINIEPQCDNKGYEVIVFNDGKMTVPQEPINEKADEDTKARQEKAYNWMHSQTQVK